MVTPFEQERSCRRGRVYSATFPWKHLALCIKCIAFTAQSHHIIAFYSHESISTCLASVSAPRWPLQTRSPVFPTIHRPWTGSPGNWLYCACLSYRTLTQRLSDSASKPLTTRGAKEATLVVVGATNNRELLHCWFPTPFAETSMRSKICNDRTVKIRV